MTRKKVKFNKWTKKEVRIIKDLLSQEYIYQEMSEELAEYGFDRSPEAIRKFIKRNTFRLTRNQKKLSKVISGKDLPDVEDIKIDNNSNVVFDLWDTMSKLSNKKKSIAFEIEKSAGKIGKPEGKLHKVISVSDLHIPWVNENVIADMLSKHKDAHTLVLNGDILDQYSVSKWRKEKQVLLQHEYEMAMDYIKEFSKIFKKVVVTRGNHDSRLQSYFCNALDPNTMFMVNPDMLDRLVNGYVFDYEKQKLVKKYNFDNVHYGSGLSGWYAKVGKCIFAHPSGGSKIPMRIAVNTADYFREKEDFDALVCSHTHKQGRIIWKGKLLIEQGCACLPMDYEADPKMKYSQQAFGYAVVYMNSEGTVDFNKSTHVYCGTATNVDTELKLEID